ncbi:amino acid ABC transporter ATP-binding/permease protein [Alishewanella longhuensis]
MRNVNSKTALQFWLQIFLKAKPQRLVIGALLALATALSGMALLALSGWFITATALAGSALLLGAVFVLDIYVPGGGIRFFALSRTVSRYAERLYNHDTVLQQIAQSRVLLFQGLQQLPRGSSKQLADADWLSRLTAELDSLDNLYLRLVLPPLVTLLAALLFFAMLALWLPVLALVGFSLLLLVTLLTGQRFCQKNLTCGSQLAEQATLSRIALIEHIEGIAELLVSQSVARQQQPLWQLSEQHFQLENLLAKQQARWQLVLNLLQSVIFVALLSAVLYAFMAQLLSGPIAVMFVLGWLGLAELLSSLPTQYAHLGKTAYAAKRLASLSQAAPKKANALAAFDSIKLTIQAHPQISSSAQSPVALNFTQQQPWYLVCGSSGSGKSTLAKALLAEDDPAVSQLWLNQQPLAHEAIASYQQQIAYLSQQNSIFADTLRYNLQLGLPPLSDEQLWQQLALVELEQWARALPRGLDTWLGDAGQNLSGGQARRLSLARLMLRNPAMVILDEPFNGLEAELSERIWHALLPWLEGRFVLLLLHHNPLHFAQIERFNTLSLTTRPPL